MGLIQNEGEVMAKAHFKPERIGSADMPVDFWIIVTIYMVLRRRYGKSLERSLDTVHAAA